MIKIKIVGTKPLLQNRFSEELFNQTAGLLDPEKVCLLRLYKDSGEAIYQPAEHIHCSMVSAAKLLKNKKHIPQLVDLILHGLIIEPEKIIHLNQRWKPDCQWVSTGNRRCNCKRMRPRLDSWALKFDIFFDKESIDEKLVREILEYAGARIGIGDHRPMFGLFSIEQFVH